MTVSSFGSHPDPIDRASDLEMAATEDAIRTVQRLNEQRQKPRADGSYASDECEACGNDIPVERLRIASNNTHCVECATAQEKYKKAFGG